MKKQKTTEKSNLKKHSLLSFVMFRKWPVVFAFIILLLAVCLGRGVNYLTKYLVDSVLISNNLRALIIISATILAMLLIEAVFYLAQNVLFSNLGYTIASDMRKKLYEKIVYAPLTYYEKTPVANIISRCTTYINELGDFFSKNFVPFALACFKLIAVFVFMFVLSYKLALIILAVLAIILVIVGILSYFSKILNRSYKKHEISRDEIIVDNVFGVETILTNGGKGNELDRFEEANKKLNRSWLKFCYVNEAFLPLVEALWFLGTIAVYMFSFGAISAGGIELGAVVAFIGYITQTTDPIGQLALNYQAFGNVQGGLNKIYDLLRLDTTARKARTKTLDTTEPTLSLKNIGYQSDGAGITIKDITFDVSFGHKVLVLGSGGSGKTTLSYCIARLYTPNKGTIRLDDVDIQNLTNPSFRAQIGLLNEDVFIFEDTLLSNMLVAKENATDDDIQAALKISGLDKKVLTLPNGLGTTLQNNGELLSAGEKQQLAFARLILQNPNIVVVDEASYALDKRSRKNFLKELNKFTIGKTLIYLSSTPLTEMEFDETYQMEDGSFIL